MRFKPLVLKSGVLAGSLLLALFLCEGAARLLLNPADYLSVVMVPDSVLGRVAAPSAIAAGFDKWGFRNPAVPERADIVALGDSHTYGNTAAMKDSWPLVLGRLSGQRVYNMGLGGYGPNQYYALFQSKALSLKPKMIICGLYLGDDFENAYVMTYGLEHWAYLRSLPHETVDLDIWKTPVVPGWYKRIRRWLSRHSVTYQVIVHGAIGERLRGGVPIRNAEQLSEGTTLDVPEKNIREAFRPKSIAKRIDQRRPRIREGMRITFKLLDDMHTTARQHDIEFVVAIIPTKEMVFSEYLEPNTTLPLIDVVHAVLADGRIARDAVVKFLTDSGISFVDTLPALKRATSQQLYVRHAADMHPSKNGYRVIAEAIHAGLSSRNE
jgi:hypothetical protein